MTIKACIEKYDNPHASLIPFIPSIWNSLKYEVRNGEVAETVQGATSVLPAIAVRLQDDPPRLNEYVHMVFRDSLDDLSEPNYVKQAGQICLAVISSGPQAFVSHSPKLVDSVIQKIPQFKSAAYTAYTGALLDILKAILTSRVTLARVYSDNARLLAAKSATHFRNLFHKVYLPLWQHNVAHAEGPELGVLKAITSGVAALVTQEVVLSDGARSLLCSVEVCKEICSLFTHRLLMPLTLSPRDAEAMVADVNIGLQDALSTVVAHYVDGFQMLVTATTDVISDRDWKRVDKRSIDHLWRVLCEVSFVGCSQLPAVVGLASSKKTYTPLQHFMTWTGTLLQLMESFLTDGSDARVVQITVAGLQHSMHCLREACARATGGSKLQQVNLYSGEGAEETLDWAKEFKAATAGADIPSAWLGLLQRSYPDIYGQMSGNKADDVSGDAAGAATQATIPNSQGVYASSIRLGIFIVRHLLRRVTKEVHAPDGTVVLHLADELARYGETRRQDVLEQIEKLAPMIISAMDAQLQRFYRLSTEAFRLFSNCKVAAPYWSLEEDGALNLLTLSILKGLWPDAMADLVRFKAAYQAADSHANQTQYDSDGIAQVLLRDDTYTLNSDISQGQAWIVALLVNKYKPSPSGMDFKQVVQFWQSRLEKNMASYNVEGTEAAIDLERVLPVLVGAFPRQERAVLPLIPLVHKAIGLPNAVGTALACEIDAVVDDNGYLQTDMHAVIKPLYKQWAYAYLVKPMYDLAVSASSDAQLSREDAARSAEQYTIAILSILKHCPFAVYESDIEPLVTMILAVLRTSDSVQHIRLALYLLQQVVRNDAAALKYHLRVILNALQQVYRVNLMPASNAQPKMGMERQKLYRDQLAAPGSNDNYRYHLAPYYSTNPPTPDPDLSTPPVHQSTATQTEQPRQPPSKTNVACRKLALELVGDIPGKFEDRYVMPFKGDMNHFLDSCCGDPVRELRRLAVEAREGWFGLG